MLRYADALTKEVTVSDDLWQALSGRFSEKEILELCFALGTAALINRVHATFLTDVDQRTSGRVGQMDLPGDIVPKARG